jgi:hypothetical protein
MTPEEILGLVDQANRMSEQRQKRERTVPWTGLGMVAVAIGTVASALTDPVKYEGESEGTANLVGIENVHSVSLATMNKYAVTSYEDESWGPQVNPATHRWGMYREQIEYVPQGALKLTAVDDARIGFYILMEETDGVRDFNFDYASLRVMVDKAEPCDLSVTGDNNEILEASQYCTPLESVNSRGLEDTFAHQGAPIRTNQEISTRGRLVHDVRINNEWCEIGLYLGAYQHQGGAIVLTGETDEETGMPMFRVNKLNITPRTAFLGAQELLKASLRRDFSLRTGLPLTNEIGRPMFLTQDDLAVLEEVMSMAGKPLTSMNAREYAAVVTLVEFSDEYDDLNPGTLDPGPTLAMELLELSERDRNVPAPKNDAGEKITEENQLTYAENYHCLPWLSAEGIEESERQWWLRTRLGGLSYDLGAYAAVQVIDQETDGLPHAMSADANQWPVEVTNLDSAVAQTAINSFKELWNVEPHAGSKNNSNRRTEGGN